MNKFIHLLLDQVTDRVSALIARLVASHIEVRCVEHQAELNSKVEELAATYAESGQDEIATRLRSVTADLFSNKVAPIGEALLNYASNQPTLPVRDGGQGNEKMTGTARGRKGSAKRISVTPTPPESVATAETTQPAGFPFIPNDK